MRLLSNGEKTDGREDLLSRLASYYHLSFKDGPEFVQALAAAGLIQGGRRWRFYHDTFEEFFAASWLVRIFDEQGQPASFDVLRSWMATPEREAEFVAVIDFVAELADEQIKARLITLSWPDLWKTRLLRELSQG